MRKILAGIFFLLFFTLFAGSVQAQQTQSNGLFPFTTPVIQIPPDSTSAAQISTPSAAEQVKLDQIKKEDITKPEEGPVKQEVLNLFQQRPADHLTYLNFIAYFIQYSVKSGVPANTVILILLLPLLASMVAFFRHVIGLPSLGMIVPVALSITLVATGLTAGVILLATIILASFVSRIILKRIRIMQLPKSALSIFVLSVFIIIALTISASIGILTVRQISIFPVLLLILLSERVVALQLERSLSETMLITTVTLIIGVLGFTLLSSQMLQNTVILYPETVLLLIPLNIAIGRYFGLRVPEYFRFSPIKDHGTQ